MNEIPSKLHLKGMKTTKSILVLGALAVGHASACMAVGAGGIRVAVASETALIVWDAQSHVEQFVRSASFVTGAKSVGFLVPTPTAPKAD
jgi:hypothetical protein